MKTKWHQETKGTQRTRGTLPIPHSALRTPHLLAFTLIEIMLVVAIMAIAVAFSYPAISDVVHRAPMTQAVRDVMDACQDARSKAILSGSPMELRIYPQEMRVEVGAVSGDAAPGSTPPAEGESTAKPAMRAPASPYTSSAKLSDDIRLEMVDVNFTEYLDADVARVRFYPNGTCDELTLVLRSDLEWRKISLECVTSLADVESDPLKFRNN